LDDTESDTAVNSAGSERGFDADQYSSNPSDENSDDEMDD